MLQINDLTMAHRKDMKILIENFTAVINRGDRVAIIGEEGNGKSILLRWLWGDPTLTDFLEIQGERINQFGSVGYLPQSLSEAELALSVADFFFQSGDFDIDYANLYQIAARLQFDVELLYATRSMKSLSGGERIKVQLLQILMKQPDLLLLDEPSNDLDIESLVWLEQFINEFSGTIVYISHDVTFLKNTATAIIHIERLVHKRQPRVTYAKLGYADYIEQRTQSDAKQQQLANQQRAADEQRMQTLRQQTQRVHHQMANTNNDVAGRLLAKKMANLKALNHRFERDRAQFVERPISEDAILLGFDQVSPLPKSKRIVSLDNYRLEVDGKQLACNISLLMNGQDKIGIIGRNGMGKSTLLQAIWQQLPDISEMKAGYMPQNYEELLPVNLSPIEYLQEKGDREELTRIMTYLGALRYLPEEMERPIQQLSGGQKAKLLLMRLDFHRCNVLFLDEPTRNFSPQSVPELIETFQRFEGAILTVSHDRAFLAAVCDKIYQLKSDGLYLVSN